MTEIKKYAAEIKSQIDHKREPKKEMAELNLLLDENYLRICKVILSLSEEQQDKFLHEVFGGIAKYVLDEKVIMNEVVSATNIIINRFAVFERDLRFLPQCARQLLHFLHAQDSIR